LIKSGYTTGLAVQLELSGQGAASTETIYALPGKVSFTYQPILLGGGGRKGVSRKNEVETNSVLYWQGSFELQHGNNPWLHALLFSFFARVSQSDETPVHGLETRIYRPILFENLTSMKLFIDFADGGPYLTLHGVVIDRITVTVSAGQIVRFKIDYKALRKETRGGVQAATTLANFYVPASTCSVLFNGTPRLNVSEFSLVFSHSKTATKIGSDKKPKAFVLNGDFDCGGELMELFESYDIADLVESLGEASLSLLLTVPGDQRSLRFDMPRVIFSSGTPPALSRSDLPYRATWKALLDADLNESAMIQATAVTTSIQQIMLTEDGSDTISEDGQTILTES
jgi:hypothetical protein